MGLLILVLAYSFGFACLVNFFCMQVRLATAKCYVERAKRMKEIREGGEEGKRKEAEEKARPFKVVFLHPDLGIGGAERLILDAAIGLQKHQHVRPMEVTVVTAHHDPQRCFKETVDGTVKVVVRGSWLPASIAGRCKVLCATLRMISAAYSTCRAQPDTDLFVVDQVAAVMPPLYFFAPCTPILFYCHFPDQKCDPNRNLDGTYKTSVPSAPGSLASNFLGTSTPSAPSSIHTAYRGFFDNIEALSMKCANSIVCNSRFSCDVTKDTFPEIKDRISADDDVFYPPVSAPLEVKQTPNASAEASAELTAIQKALSTHTTTFVSINRFERNKNTVLAVEAFADLLSTAENPSSLMLVVAGGYDSRLPENVSYYKELEEVARTKRGIPADQFLLLQNISDEEKQVLLRGMRALLYTPANEHFGIVPVEAMMTGKPVIAVNHGGPCESVGDVHTCPDEAGGILCEPTPAAFREAMQRLATDAAFAEKLGAQGKARATTQFSIELFSEKLATRLEKLHEKIGALVWDTYKGEAGWKEKKEDGGGHPQNPQTPQEAQKKED